jgi:hypothetical protein
MPYYANMKEDTTLEAKKVIFERLVNTGNYSHEKYAIEIELEPGDTVQKAFDAAKQCIKKQVQQCGIHIDPRRYEL